MHSTKDEVVRMPWSQTFLWIISSTLTCWIPVHHLIDEPPNFSQSEWQELKLNKAHQLCSLKTEKQMKYLHHHIYLNNRYVCLTNIVLWSSVRLEISKIIRVDICPNLDFSMQFSDQIPILPEWQNFHTSLALHQVVGRFDKNCCY